MSAARPLARPVPDPDADAQNRERQFSALFAHAPVGIAECLPGGTITAMNSTMRRMLEPDLGADALPIALDDLIHSDDQQQYDQLFCELMSGKRESFQIERRTAGAGAWAKWTAWRVGGNGTWPTSALLIAEDTTESRQSELRLRQAERLEAVGRLASGVAHDFNNLLTGVLLHCDLLLGGLESGHRVHQYAEEIRAATVQASGLVRQLLAVARPQSTMPRPLSLNEVAHGMRNLLTRLIGENIELEFHLDPQLGLVKMDSSQAQQILLNLVLNARDALPEGGRIHIETRNCRLQIMPNSQPASGRDASLPCALFVVSDNGKGMDAETRAHLFEAFFTTKPAGTGTGLGLATVHDIVISNGGIIHVDSAPHRGARVTLLLPLIPDSTLHSLCTQEREQARSKPTRSTQPKEQMP